MQNQSLGEKDRGADWKTSAQRRYIKLLEQINPMKEKSREPQREPWGMTTFREQQEELGEGKR